MEHRSRIKNRVMEAPMVQHFISTSHSPDSFKFIVLEVIIQTPDKGGDIHTKSAEQETFWIYKLRTLHPSGLNTNIDFSVYL